MPLSYRPREHRSPMNFPTLGISVSYGDVIDDPALEKALADNPDFQKVKGDKHADGKAAADPAAEQTGAGDAGRS